MFRTTRSLHARFLSRLLVVSAVLALLASIVIFSVARDRYMVAGEQAVRAMVSAVQQSLAVGTYARDEVLLRELTDGLARHPSVVRAEVHDLQGVLLTTSAGRAVQAHPVASATAAVPSDFRVPLASPFNARETVGTLDLWYDRARLAADAGQQAGLLVAALVVLIGVMLGIFTAMAKRMLSRPMHQLAHELALATPGSNHRLSVDAEHREDEVGVVAAAANQLLDLQDRALAREREMRTEIAAMEARYRGIFDSTSAGIFIVAPDGRLQQGNPALWQLLGIGDRGASDVPRAYEHAQALFADPAQLQQLMASARASMQPESADIEMVHAQGRELWVHCMLTAVDDAGDAPRIEGVLYDITGRRQRERAAQHRAEHDALTGLKSRAAFEWALGQRVQSAQQQHGALTLMFIDLDGFKSINDNHGHAAGDAVLVESAHRLRALFKRSTDVVGRLGGDELVVMMDGVHATDAMVSELATEVVQRFSEPFLLPQGGFGRIGASVGVASYPQHAHSADALLNMADQAMYAAKQAGKGGYRLAGDDDRPAERIAPAPRPVAERATWQDPLTGLADRRRLGERLAQLGAAVQAGGSLAAVVCLDIDQFKTLNLVHGPRVGDEVLCEAARRLRLALRRADMLARTGSDEFVAVLDTEATHREGAVQVTRRIVGKLTDALAQSFVVSAGALPVHVSVGVSLIESDTPDATQALQEAQLALRLAKGPRRGEVMFFEPEMMAGFLQARALEDDLRRAVAAGQLRLHVQPQVDRAGRVCGGEALVRWQHPERGLLTPDAFIALAESSGVIVELGRWVLREGCELLARMRQHDAGLTLAVNISPAQFAHPDFVTDVRDALRAARAPAEGLTLEITEGLLIADIEQVSSRLTELTVMGVRVSIDDFGTGFSSLAYLRQLPLHEIKIDRSFVVGLPGDAASAGIVRAILSMGVHLSLNVVAEGVEVQAQSDFLRAQGCALQQGWLHGRPMPAEGFVQALGEIQAACA